MSRRILTVPLSVAALLVAGLLVPVTASAAPGDGDCEGMTAPPTTPTTTSPEARPDTASVLAGGTVVIPVLANDIRSSPVSVITTSTPTYGGTCIDSSGAVEYFADLSATSHTDSFIYGITDGHFYSQVTVTVNVQGVLPVDATVLKKARNGTKARLSFTNANAGSVLILAGAPKKRRPDVRRTVAGNSSTVIRSSRPKVFYVVTTFDALGNEVPVSYGTVNTRTGRVKASSFADTRARAIARRWTVGSR